MFHVIGRKQYNGYQLQAAFYFSRPRARAVTGSRRSQQGGEGDEASFLVGRCHKNTEILILIGLSLYCFVLRGAATVRVRSQVVSPCQAVGAHRGGKSRNVVIVISAPESPWEPGECNHGQLPLIWMTICHHDIIESSHHHHK